MATQRAIKVIDNDDDYLGDIFSDERMLLEEIDPEDMMISPSPANQDLWDMLDVTDEGWDDITI